MLRLRRACSSFTSSSFLARAAAAKDPAVLIGKFQSAGRFDDIFTDNFETHAIGPDGVSCTLKVTPQLCNNYGVRLRRGDST